LRADVGIGPYIHVEPRTIQHITAVPWGFGPMWASAPTFSLHCVPFNVPRWFR